MPHQQRSHPRKYGKDSRACRVTGQNDGLIRKYGLMMSRQCFREQANQIGFFKLKWAMIWNTRKTWREYTESRPEINQWKSLIQSLHQDNSARESILTGFQHGQSELQAMKLSAIQARMRDFFDRLLGPRPVMEHGIYLVWTQGETPSLDTTILDTS